MKFAIFGKEPTKENIPFIQELFNQLTELKEPLLVWDKFFHWIKASLQQTDNIKLFSNEEDLKNNADILFSLGGDGTMLDTLSFVRNTDIAVLGINLGHLGFLTTAGKQEIGKVVRDIKLGNFSIERRNILEVGFESEKEFSHFAINELCVLSSYRGTIIDAEVFVNGKYLTRYSGDGILISTPTGSTAYSLSCNGPIITPDSCCLCITPVAPHNLTFRPIVISDKDTIRIHLPEDNENDANIMVDGYIINEVDNDFVKVDEDIIIKKSDYEWKLVRLDNQDFFSALRNKLMWGTNIKDLKYGK
ncbi:MAG: NAD(+)/NADH kinase [Bacteroidales bacterium]|nr:NAD(+)/NADH kinase [Bacteroidales bacterium]